MCPAGAPGQHPSVRLALTPGLPPAGRRVPDAECVRAGRVPAAVAVEQRANHLGEKPGPLIPHLARRRPQVSRRVAASSEGRARETGHQAAAARHPGRVLERRRKTHPADDGPEGPWPIPFVQMLGLAGRTALVLADAFREQRL